MVLKVFLLFLFLTFTKSNQLCPELCVCDMAQNLRRAKCINEKFTTIDANIPTEVQFLDFSNNMISTLHDSAFKELGLVKLVILNISTNSLNQISLRAFDSLEKIQIIDLSNNVLHSLPEDLFENNLELLKLYLSGNKFGFLEAKPFLNSQSLQILDLSNCVIAHLHSETFSQLAALTTLDISNNFIIQLNLETFQNLFTLRHLHFRGNKIVCNQEVLNLIKYLNKNQIKHENICDKTEKFQRMILPTVTTEKSRLLNWNFDNCDDIDSLPNDKNDTNCQITYDNNNINTFLVIISFCVGLISGVCVSCCYVNCVYAMKRKNRGIRRSKHVRQMSQPRDEFLLNENSFNLGLSTPVLSRVKHNNIVR